MDDEWNELETLAKKGLPAATPQVIIRLIALARSEQKLRRAFQTIMEQPFDGSWDAQARFCAEVLCAK